MKNFHPDGTLHSSFFILNYTFMRNTYLAVDFGGGSGRVMAGYIDEGKLILEEVHRFGNRQVKLGEHVYWDFPALFQDMKDGLKKAAQKGYQVKSIGIDTWGWTSV